MLSIFGWLFIFLNKVRNKCISSYYKRKFISCGKNVYISQGCSFSLKNIVVGNNVYFGKNCIIQSMHGKIKIGNEVMFGPGVHIHGGNHKMEVGSPMFFQTKGLESDPDIVIEDDCWIGANAIILKGVRVEKGSVIGAGSVVTKDVPSYSIVVGNPGRVIKKRE